MGSVCVCGGGHGHARVSGRHVGWIWPKGLPPARPKTPAHFLLQAFSFTDFDESPPAALRMYDCFYVSLTLSR